MVLKHGSRASSGAPIFLTPCQPRNRNARARGNAEKKHKGSPAYVCAMKLVAKRSKKVNLPKQPSLNGANLPRILRGLAAVALALATLSCVIIALRIAANAGPEV